MHRAEDEVFHLFEKQRQGFIAKKQRLFSEYMQSLTKSPMQNRLLSCTGWNEVPKNDPFSLPSMQRLLTSQPVLTQEGGYFFRYNETGIAINPGKTFFERFTSAGFHLWHIDTVIITNTDPRMRENVELLYQFNREFNTTLLSNGQEPHVITYLLHPEAYGILGPKLRPLFREEQASVISLESFEKAKEEKQAISRDISLFYKKQQHGLLLRFELQNGLSFGYSAPHWDNDVAAEFFSSCRLLIASHETVLSPHFTAASLDNIELLLVGDFIGNEGDFRLELTKQLRLQRPKLTILPLEKTISVDLDHLTVYCNAQESLPIAAHEVEVVRKNDFEKLLYTMRAQTL